MEILYRRDPAKYVTQLAAITGLLARNRQGARATSADCLKSKPASEVAITILSRCLIEILLLLNLGFGEQRNRKYG
jgi:hypothetical protein